jgi:Flp pilus assembly pilin Flp
LLKLEEDMLKTIVCSVIRDERGEDLIEYALVAGLVSILSAVVANVVHGL